MSRKELTIFGSGILVGFAAYYGYVQCVLVSARLDRIEAFLTAATRQ